MLFSRGLPLILCQYIICGDLQSWVGCTTPSRALKSFRRGFEILVQKEILMYIRKQNAHEFAFTGFFSIFFQRWLHVYESLVAGLACHDSALTLCEDFFGAAANQP